MKGIKHNGVSLTIEDWSPMRKKPVLVVSFDGEATHYKVASFNSKAEAEWFAEICDEFFRGLVNDET